MIGRYFKLGETDYNYRDLIFVEGKDDAMLLDIVLSYLNKDPLHTRIIICEGKSGFAKQIPLVKKSFQFLERIKSVSIISDADNNIEAATDSIHKSLRKVSLPLPRPGHTITSGGKTIGIYLFPRPGETGDLEKLALGLANRSDEASEAEEFVIRGTQRNKITEKIDKRKIQAYLSVRSKEIRPTVGWAFKDGTIPITLDDVPELTSFLKSALS